jgi:hypothetical protein
MRVAMVFTNSFARSGVQNTGEFFRTREDFDLRAFRAAVYAPPACRGTEIAGLEKRDSSRLILQAYRAKIAMISELLRDNLYLGPYRSCVNKGV